MIPVFAVGDSATARRLLKGRAVLVSHAYIGSFVSESDLPVLLGNATESWCDCGEFTRWQRRLSGKCEACGARPADGGRAVCGKCHAIGASGLTVEGWAQFIIANANRFTWFVALDAIGNAEESLRNWHRLLALVPHDLHAKVVPVWHEGDPLEHLQEYDPSSRLVGLGRTAGRKAGPAGKKATLEFYDTAFNEYPNGIYHLLGNCNPDTVELFNARSFDATTWQRDSAYGNSHGWPWSAVSKELRMLAYIEAISTMTYRPRALPRQMELVLA